MWVGGLLEWKARMKTGGWFLERGFVDFFGWAPSLWSFFCGEHESLSGKP